MNNFRKLKSQLIRCKRQSQKIEQREIGPLRQHFLKEQQHRRTVSQSVLVREHLKNKMLAITPQCYKINDKGCLAGPVSLDKGDYQNKTLKLLPIMSQSSSSHNKESVPLKDSPHGKQSIDLYSEVTVKKSKIQYRQIGLNASKYEQTLELIRCLNRLERKRLELQSTIQQRGAIDKISYQIDTKTKDIKALIGELEGDHCCSFKTVNPMNFFEDSDPNSEASGAFSSQRTVACDTLREHNEELSELSDNSSSSSCPIKFRRINPGDEQWQEESREYHQDQEDTFSEESLDMSFEDSRIGEQKHDFVHLFSYDHDKNEFTPLSRITQRSSEDFSPESFETSRPKHELSEDSLEYKKILYMLQTTDRRQKISDSSSKVEKVKVLPISPFELCPEPNKDKRGVLKDIVNLLRDKYHKEIDLKHLFKEDGVISDQQPSSKGSV